VNKREFRISRQADKFIRSLQDNERKAVRDAVGKLIEGNTQGLDIVRYLPYPKEFRLRVGRVRLLFKSAKNILFIFKADFRKDVYRR